MDGITNFCSTGLAEFGRNEFVLQEAATMRLVIANLNYSSWSTPHHDAYLK
jgi:hypothetical protein